MGVVVRKYIDILTIIINFPYSTCISSLFWQQHPYFFVHLKNVFSVLFVIFLQYNVTQRTFEIVQKKSRSREYNYLIISIIKNVNGARARVPRLPRARYRMTFN